MTWMEEVSYQYRENEYFFVDVPAIFQFCLPALFQDFLRLCGLLIIANLCYQLVNLESVFKGQRVVKNYLASFIGALLLLYFYPVPSVGLIVVLLISSYLLITDRKLFFFILSSFLATGWFLGVLEVDIRLLQGPLMIVAMKVYCVLMRDEKSGPIDLSLFLHYCLSPSSVVFGPIIPFDEFRAKVFQTTFTFPLGSLLNGTTGTFLTFITANCICQSVEWAYTGDEVTPYHIRFLTAYKQALEFRMSHYFICYLSTFQMHLGTPKLADPIVDFWAIEAPKSMKAVVRSWNMPMHGFLKRFVFQKIRPRIGAVLAVVLTFLISAGLHMFEIRVTVVLFGLSLVSVIQSRLEGHLPKALGELWMRVTTFIHLVFFGCIMMSGDQEEVDQPYLHFVMDRWLELGFISFKILIVECVLCVVFEVKRLISASRK